jgi:hypothetical protein
LFSLKCFTFFLILVLSEYNSATIPEQTSCQNTEGYTVAFSRFMSPLVEIWQHELRSYIFFGNGEQNTIDERQQVGVGFKQTHNPFVVFFYLYLLMIAFCSK